jgi:hypothetical protein
MTTSILQEASGLRERRSPNVRLAPPSPRLMRLINPVVRRVLSSPRLGRRIGTLTLLQFLGKRTGGAIYVPVALHTIDGIPTVFTSRRWRLNFAGGANVAVLHGGEVHSARGVLLDATPEQTGTALRKALDGGATPFILGLKISRGYEPTIADLASAGLSQIRIDFDTAN